MISKKNIKYISKLSKLNFTEKEEEKIIVDLNKIIDSMEKLNELNVENIDMTINPYYMENQYREDEVMESLSLDEVLKNAPNYEDEYIIVPNVIE